MKPMLATLTHDHFSSEEWLYERKFDGERSIVVSNKQGVTLYSRNKKNLNKTYPELVDTFASVGNTKQFIVDGEIVAFKGNVTSFSKLQNRIGLTKQKDIDLADIDVYMYIFDVLYADGYDLTGLTLDNRKKILPRIMKYSNPVRLTEYQKTKGEQYHAQACRSGWEGVIAKKRDSTYVHSRSPNWLKFKCVNEQELVIAGYTDPQGSRIGFGALLVGYYERGKLKYAGKVGTGYDDDTLKTMHRKMKKIKRKTSPFDDEVREKNVHWIRPTLVGEFGFTEWTNDNKLRHPRFLGLRRDKEAKNVHKEQ